MSQSSKNSPSHGDVLEESTALKFEAVEPRVLFSATAIDPVEASEGAHHSLPQVQEEAPAMQQETPAASTSGDSELAHPNEDAIIEGLNFQASNLEGTKTNQVVFVSAGLFDAIYLADNLDPAYEVFLIEPGTDAIEQIASALEGRTDISAIHLLGHGEEGRLLLGDTELDAESMQGQHRAFLEAIGSTLSDDADILIYGCDFTSGEAGTQAAALLSSITGADVAASDNKTGNTELGGDWILETHFGEIEAESISLASWTGLLAPPTISVPALEIITLEDQPITFTGADLITVGSDEVSNLTVTLSVTQGALNLSGVAGITFTGGTQNGDSTLIFSGAIANLNGALDGLVYTPTLDSYGSDTLSIIVDDGTDLSTSGVALVVSSQNDEPVLVVTPVNASGTGTPSETTPHTFTLADFIAVDPDNSDNQITYIIESLPSVGDLQLNGHPVIPGSVFTQTQLASGALVYFHNGGETHTDSFSLTVNDGAGGTDAMVVIPITITAINDAMSVVTEALVYEGGSSLDGAIAPGKPVPVLSLSISDAESDTKSVRITSLPGGGTLYFDGTALTPTDITNGFSFTANLFNLLEYRHDGVDDLGHRPSDRSFTFEVTDAGGGAGAVETVNHTVNIKVVSVNDDLDLLHLSTGVISSLGSSDTYVLSTSDVEVNDPDGDNNELTYTLVSTPIRGDLYINGRLSGAGATFTQADLTSGQVVLVNGGFNGPGSLFLKVTDSSISILTDELGTLRTGDFSTPARILELQFEFTSGVGGGTQIRLEEGGSAPFPGLTAGDIIELGVVPDYGQILINGVPLAVGSSYVYDPGDTVVYQHDGSHVDSDSIDLTLNGSSATILVKVILTNDAPVLTILSTVTGIHEGTDGVITAAHLSAVDEETTDPALLVYTVIGSPSAGTLKLNGNVIGAFGTFTHQDVINGNVSYFHDGEEQFLDSVTLQLSDGALTDIKTLNIQVTPVNDQPVISASFLELLEGELKSFSSSSLGFYDVDGVGSDIPLSQDSPLQIRVDSLPTFGTLVFNDPTLGLINVTAGFVFDQADISRLSYQHDSSENFSDSFLFTAIDNNTYANPGFDAPETISGTMNIGIIPVNDAPVVATNAGLVNDIDGDRRLYEGGFRVLTPDVLSSSDPDSTYEQVQYRITSAPVNGTVLLNGIPVSVGTAFSQADVVAGRVKYVHNGSETSTDQFKFRIDDGSSNVSEETFLIEIVPVDDAPRINAPSNATVNTADFQFNGARTVSISDADAGSGDVTVTLTVTDPGGLLRVTSTTGLTSVTGNDTSNVLILVGTVTDVNAALATLRYRATDLDSAATLTINVNDNGNTGVDPSQVPVGQIVGLVDTGTATDEQANRVINLLVSPIDDAPVNTVPLVTQTTYEDVALVFNSGNGNAISISDVDAFSGDLEITLSVTNGKITLGTTTGLIFSSGDGTSDGTMTFRGTVAEVNAALSGLTYLGDANYNGPDTLQITTNDLSNTGDGGPLSDTDSIAITVIGVNDAPTIAGPSSTVTVNSAAFPFNGGNTISIGDIDISTGLATVTLTVSDAGGILEVSTLTGLTAVSGNGTSNVLTFTGTLADVNSSLATLTYSPTDVDGTGTLTVLVSDNGNTGVDPSTIGQPNTGTATDEQAIRVFNLQISDINDAPVNTVPGTQTFNEDTALIFSTANGNAVSIEDVDAFGFDVTTTVSVLNGTLTAGGTAPQQAALTSMTGSGTNTLVLTGTIAEINAVLQGLSYSNPLNFNGTDTLTIVTNDNGNTGAGGPLSDTDTVGLVITPVNDAPVNTVPVAQNVAEDGVLTFSAGNGNAVRVSDVDVTEGSGNLTVSIGVSNGTLTLSETTGLSFLTGDGTADATMTFTGTAADINAALEGMTFHPVPDYNGPALLSLTTGDGGNFGSGGTLSDADTVAITVTPVVDITNDTVTTLEDTAITFNVITGTNGATADSFEGSPAVSAINGTPVILGSSVVIANGSVRVDATSGLLTFTPTGNYNGQTSFTYTVTSPTGVTETATVTVNVTPVNDAPVNTIPGTQTITEEGAQTFSAANGNAISIADVDAATGDLTTTLTVSNGTLTVGGTVGQQAVLTSITGSGTNTLVLTGTISEINAVLEGLVYASNSNFNGNDTLTIVTNDNGNMGAGGPLSDTDTVGLVITPVNDAPVNTVPVAQTVAEDGVLTFSAGNGNVVSVSDVDVAEGTGILSVTVGVSNGTLTLSGTTGLTFSSGDGSGDGTMTFSGTATNINAALEGMTFHPVPDYNGPALLSLTTNDGGNVGTGGTLSDADTVAITVTPVVDITNDEVTTVEDTAITFNVITGTNGATTDSFEGTPAVSAINGTPVGNGSMVSVSNGTVTVDATSGLLTFTPAGGYNGQTTFSYTVTSPTGVTETATVTVNIGAYNDAPVNTIPGTQTFNEDTGRVFSTANGNAISIADVDAATGDVTTTVSVLTGTITVGGTVGEQAVLTSITGSGTNTLVLTGTIAEINAVLQGLSYSSPLNFNGSDTLTILTNDNGNTGAGGPMTDEDTVSLIINPVNDAPVNTVPLAQTVAEDGVLTFSAGNGNAISIADVDAATGDLTTTLTVVNGTLTIGGTVGQQAALTSIAGSGTGTLVLTGTLSEINAVLEGLVYTPDLNFNGNDSLSITTNDNGNTGSGGPLSDVDSFGITVNPVNDAPVNTVPGMQTFNEDEGLIFSTANGNTISIADIDAATGDVTTTVTVTKGMLIPGGSLVQQSALTSIIGSGTGTLVLTGTIAEINAVLEGLVYTTPENVNGNDTLSITTNDNGNTGSGGPLSDQDSVSLVIRPVNDDPVRVGTISDRTNNDSDPIHLNVTGFFDDVDTTDALTFTATDLPPGLTIDLNTGVISGTINSSASVGGPYTVVITADDGNGGTVTQTFVWTVNNPSPVANDDEFSASKKSGAIIVGNAITNNDNDPDGDTLTAQVQTNVVGTSGGLFSIDANGNVTFDHNGEFEDLIPGVSRKTSFTYTVTDADGATSSATVTVTVHAVRPTPILRFDINQNFLFDRGNLSHESSNLSRFLHFQTSGSDYTKIPVVLATHMNSGQARPGSTITLEVYNRRGELISSESVTADSGGNWLVSLSTGKLSEQPARIVMKQAWSTSNLGNDSGYDVRTYFAPAFSSGTYYTEELSIWDVVGRRSATEVIDLFEASKNSIILDWNGIAYEFDPVSGR